MAMQDMSNKSFFFTKKNNNFLIFFPEKKNMPDRDTVEKWTKVGVLLGIGGTVFGVCLASFRVAHAGQYIVRTGMMVRGRRGIDVLRRGFVWPFIQRVDYVSVQPITLTLSLKCLSSQYLPFTLPVRTTLSPVLPDDLILPHNCDNMTAEDYFKCYVQKIYPLSHREQREIFEAAIHGALRVETSKLSIDDINDSREAFQTVAVQQAQLVLNQYGVRINSANIAEIQEEERNGEMGYLKARERKKLTDAIQQSEIDVGEAMKLGNIGKKERESETRQRVAFLESDTKTQENTAMQQIALSQADLIVAESAAKQRADISMIEADTAAQKVQEERQAEIETLRALQRLEAERAVRLTAARVDAEVAEQAALGQKKAILLQTEASVYQIQEEAKARRFASQEEAAGIQAKGHAVAANELAQLQARAQGMKELTQACPNEQLISVMEIQNGIPQKKAEEAAKAMNGLNPQIWSMTSDDPHTALSKMIAGFAPIIDVVQKTIRRT